jgi:glycosyltransferase 2 family protein
MVFGVLLLVTLIVVLTHVAEERRFVALLTHFAPTWLLVAAGCQVGTYVCAAAVWSCVLRRASVAPRLHTLVPLGLAKLFVDQIVPTAGVGGTLLVVRGLVRRGVPPPLATAALLMDLFSFYAAHVGAVLLAVGIIWVHHEMHPVILILAVLFAVIAIGVPLTILRLNRRGSRSVPPWVRRLPILARVVQAMAAAPAELLRDRWLLLQTSGLQFAIIVLDAATLDVMLRAIGHVLASAAVFASFTMSALLAILGVIPGGLGLFEGGAVAMLRWFGVPVEAGLAATLLLRAWTFWLPMAPGMWMARHEARELEP